MLLNLKVFNINVFEYIIFIYLQKSVNYTCKYQFFNYKREIINEYYYFE